MSGLAEVLFNLGYEVSGSDIKESGVTERLRVLGINLSIGHKVTNLDDVDMVIKSTAIEDTNVELTHARKLGLPILERAELLSSLMNMKRGVAIAGTHGKTTTTCILATIMTEAMLDPTFINGGIINSFASNAKLGTGDYMLAEADESDGSFLSLSPTIAVLTNIDYEHLDYYETIEDIRNAFISFVNKVPFYGKVILNIDDSHIQSILPDIKKKFVTYGLSSNAEIGARNIVSKNQMQLFELRVKEDVIGTFSVSLHGIHNVYNTLAAIATAVELGVEPEKIKKALKHFSGIERRFQYKGEVQGVKVYDDYGHHPAEIKFTLQGFKSLFPDKKLVTLFQPHRYSRTHHLE